MELSRIDFIQSVWIDNSLNASSITLTITSAIGSQSILVQANTQGIYPVIAAGKVKWSAASAGNVQVPLIWSNTAKPFVQWGPQLGVAVAGNIPTGSFTNKSGTIAVGGTSQQITPVNLNRKKIIIENPATAAGQGIAAAESLFINFTAAAGVNNGTSIELLPGGSYDSGTTITTEAINVNAATTGHVFIAKEM